MTSATSEQHKKEEKKAKKKALSSFKGKTFKEFRTHQMDSGLLELVYSEERRRSKPIRELRKHIKKHRGKSAKSSQEKPGGGYKGEECLEEDDPNDPNDPSECV